MAINTRSSAKQPKRPPTKAVASSVSKRSSGSSQKKKNNNKSDDANTTDVDNDTSIKSCGKSSSTNNILISPRENELSERMWWMVDIMFDDDEGSSATTQGATALVKRCMRVYNWNLEKTRKILIAYRQFLTLKKLRKDWDATILSPSYLVDQMWHQHILDVVNYNHDMMLLCGHVVGHNPDGALDGKKAERDEATRHALEEKFANKYDKEVWGEKMNQGVTVLNVGDNELTVRVRDHENPHNLIPFIMMKTAPMEALFNTYAQRKGLPVSELLFTLDGRGDRGRRILPRDRLEFMYLGSNDKIKVYQNKQITVKVTDENGHQTCCNIGMTSHMHELFHVYAHRRGILRSQLIFTSEEGGKISSDDMPIDIPSLRDNKQINVYRNEASYLNGDITVRFKDDCGEESMYKMKRTGKMGAMFRAHAARKGDCVHTLVFMINGERVGPELSPVQLELGVMDQVDCFHSQAAC